MITEPLNYFCYELAKNNYYNMIHEYKSLINDALSHLGVSMSTMKADIKFNNYFETDITSLSTITGYYYSRRDLSKILVISYLKSYGKSISHVSYKDGIEVRIDIYKFHDYVYILFEDTGYVSVVSSFKNLFNLLEEISKTTIKSVLEYELLKGTKKLLSMNNIAVRLSWYEDRKI